MKEYTKDGLAKEIHADADHNGAKLNHSGRKRRKKRKRSGRWLSLILFVISLAAVTGCLFLTYRNKMLQKKVMEAMAVIEKKEQSVDISKEEAELLAREAAGQAKEQAVAESKSEILGTVKGMMEEGEGTSALLRLLFPEELVVASDGRYYFFPILDTLRHHSYIYEQFVLDENQEITYIADGKTASRKGIDVSKYQGEIDWSKVAQDQVEYAFIRLGNRGATEGKITLDETYEANMEGAIENGISVGVYFFTQALNPEEAVEEAKYVLQTIEPYNVTYPIVLDVETVTNENARTANMSKQEWTDVCIAFCEEIQKAGYTPMLYGNLKTFLLMVDMAQLEEYEKWFAYYNTPLYFPYEFSIWQYTSKGNVAGIQGDVDLNVSMKHWE